MKFYRRIFLILFCLPFLVAGQTNSEREVSLKANLLTYRFYLNDDEDPYGLEYIIPGRFEFPSFAVVVKDKKNNIHDFEILNFHWWKHKPANSYTQRVYSFQAGYSYLWSFLKKRKKNLPIQQPFIGAGVGFLYQNVFNEPTDHNSFPLHYDILNAYIQLIPGINYQPTKRVYLQFTIPLSWLVYGYQKTYVDNPTLTEEAKTEEQSRRQVVWYFPERIGLRLAVGYIF